MGLSVKHKLIILCVFLLVSTLFLSGLYLATRPILDSQGNVIISDVSHNSNFLRNYLLISSLSFFVLMLLAVFIISIIIKPLDEVIVGTQLVASGNFDQKIPILKYDGNDDEFGRLVRTFNSMVSRLKIGQKSRIKARDAANKERTKIELIANAICDGVIVTDKNNKIVLFNDAASIIFNLDSKRVIGKHILQLRRHGLDRLYLSQFEKGSKMPFKMSASKKPRQCRSGKAIWFEVKPLGKQVHAQLSPIFDAQGNYCGAVSVIRDVTQLKQTENMKKDFISRVSHELRTPLTSIKGYASLLEVGKMGETNYRQSKALKIINKESDRLISLVDDLLDVSKLDAGSIRLDFENVDIRDCINSLPALDFARRKDITLNFDISRHVPLIMADKKRLMQVFNNLVGNAIKFTDEKGAVEVKVEKQKEPAGFLAVSIIDNGVGMQKSDVKHLFEKFYQAEDPMTRLRSGTGLGLSIVKRIIELHGGTININSSLGKGTEVRFSLPIKQTLQKDQ